MNTTRTGGEALVHGLLSHGIDTVFGIPGVQNDHLYNAIYAAGDRIRHIHTRHEQGVAYMALASGKTGVFSCRARSRIPQCHRGARNRLR